MDDEGIASRNCWESLSKSNFKRDKFFSLFSESKTTIMYVRIFINKNYYVHIYISCKTVFLFYNLHVITV